MLRKIVPLPGWNETLLDELAERGSGHTPDKKRPEFWNGGIKWVSLSDGPRLDRGYINDTAKEISALGIRHSSAVIHPRGTVILLRDADVGRCAILGDDMAVSQHFIAWKCLENGPLHNEFLYYQLQNRKFEFKRVANGSTIQTIGLPFFKSFRVQYPSLAEQRRIAEILSSWDEAIETISGLINLRHEKYLGIRNRLINWSSGEHTELNAFLKLVVRPVSKPKTAYRALSLRSHGKGSYSRIVQNPESVDMDTLYVAKSGDVIVNITFAWEGAVALVPPEHDGCLVSHRFPTFIPINDIVNARYLRHTLRTSRFTHLLSLVSPGGAGRNRVLNKNDFLMLEVPLPSVFDQEKIGATLDSAEEAVKIETKRRECLVLQKHGLMQKLLTGEWRVPVRDSDVDAMAPRVTEEAAQ